MKKIILFTITLFITANCMAQAQLAFPFQGVRWRDAVSNT